MQSRNKREGYYCGVVKMYIYPSGYRKKLIYKRKCRGGHIRGLK